MVPDLYQEGSLTADLRIKNDASVYVNMAKSDVRFYAPILNINDPK